MEFKKKYIEFIYNTLFTSALLPIRISLKPSKSISATSQQERTLVESNLLNVSYF